MQRTPLVRVHDQQFHVVVIGGGIVGAAIARDAAMRGYRTILLEKDDFGAGSSCKAPRLLFGGPAFVERLDLKHRRQLERECRIHLHSAPHLIRPIKDLYAVPHAKAKPAALQRSFLGALQASFFPEGRIHRIKTLSSKRLQSSCSFLSPVYQKRGYQAADYLVPSPERLCVENVLSAQLNGADVVNYAKVLSVQVHNRKVQGVVVEDRVYGKNYRLLGHCIINATGPWMDEVCQMADERYISRLKRRKVTHIVIPQLDPPLQSAIIFHARSDGEPIELVPWHDQLLLGIASNDKVEDLDSPKGDKTEIDYLLSELQQLIPTGNIGQQSIRYAFSAVHMVTSEIRRSPLSSGSLPIILDHGRMGGPKGFISAVSGRLADYRSLAQQAVDAIESHVTGVKVKACQTPTERLFGGNIQQIETFVDEVSHAARNYALTEEQVRHLVSVYGTKSQEIFHWLKDSPQLREPICQHQPDILAQVLYAVDREMAVSLGDIFLRRTGIGVTRCRGVDCASTAAATLSDRLGWSEARLEAEIENYHRELESTYWQL